MVLTGLNAPSVLLLGCRAGLFAPAFVQAGCSLVSLADHALSNDAIDFVQGRLRLLPAATGCADVVFMCGLPRGARAVERCLRELLRVGRMHSALLLEPLQGGTKKSSSPLHPHPDSVHEAATKVGFGRVYELQLERGVLFMLTHKPSSA
jgi:hypothetical protein